VVAADERAFVRAAERKRPRRGRRGYYEIALALARGLGSASPLGVSFLVRVDSAVLPLTSFRQHCLGLTVLVPSGHDVALTDLFTDRVAAFRAEPALATVPDRALRPYLSKLGARLVRGAHRPSFRDDTALSYCGIPHFPGSELSAPATSVAQWLAPSSAQSFRADASRTRVVRAAASRVSRTGRDGTTGPSSSRTTRSAGRGGGGS
jgi:hypothetical protein